MSFTRKQIWFKHLDGSQKFIPGVRSSDDLAPRMKNDVLRHNGRETPVYRRDNDHVVKITLHDENPDTELSESEKKLPERVQERILDRRSQETDFAIQANNSIRRTLRAYEESGAVKVLEWNKEVDPKSEEAKGSIITQLSEIALADFADRGIDVPAHLMPRTVGKEAKVTSK